MTYSSSDHSTTPPPRTANSQCGPHTTLSSSLPSSLASQAPMPVPAQQQQQQPVQVQMPFSWEPTGVPFNSTYSALYSALDHHPDDMIPYQKSGLHLNYFPPSP